MTSTARTSGPPVVEASTDEVVQRVRALVRPDARVMLGITGAPGVGKTTLVEALGAELAHVAAVVGMDGFHLADVELGRLDRRARKGAHDTFDVYGYTALLGRLRADEDPVVYAPWFDRAQEEPIAGAVPIDRDAPLIVTEGNYLLLDAPGWTAARGLLDQVWFLELPEHERTARLVARHQRYGMDAAAALDRATAGSDGDNARLIAATRDRADLVLRVHG
jgi:pantothenate kinase